MSKPMHDRMLEEAETITFEPNWWCASTGISRRLIQAEFDAAIREPDKCPICGAVGGDKPIPLGGQHAVPYGAGYRDSFRQGAVSAQPKDAAE